jgi:2'-5' RNA ligase
MRLFIAVELPEAVRGRLAALGGGVPGARWTAMDNLHLTLRFMGEVAGPALEDLAAALDGLTGPSFELSLAGVGQYGAKRRARIIWAGVAASPPLMALQARIESAVVRAGFDPEQRKFRPHITLARLKGAAPERVGAFLADHGLYAEPPFPVDGFTLFSSHLAHTGAIYTPEIRYPLGV